MASLTLTLRDSPLDIFNTSLLAPLDVRSQWQIVGSNQQLPTFNPAVDSVPTVSLLLSFPALDTSNFTADEVSATTAEGPLADLLYKNFVDGAWHIRGLPV